MNNIELTVVGVNPKQFFTFKEGDTAYTFQWSSNYFGQYLVETEVKVGGLRRSIIIPKGKEKSGWKGFGIELTKLLEPNQYALVGLRQEKAIARKHKHNSEIQISQSFAEVVKGLEKTSGMEQPWQPIVSGKGKRRLGEEDAGKPSHLKPIKMVPVEKIGGKPSQIAVGGGNGSGRRIMENVKVGEKILEEIKKRFMLQFSSNSNEINNGKECYIRNSCWIRKGCVG